MNKEQNILSLFYNEPMKRWHFEDILREASISRPQAFRWLKKLQKEQLIKRIKPRGKNPFYQANYSHPSYQVKKRLAALQQLEASGFLTHIASLPKVKAAFLFGSFSRWDWDKQSDIDLFIYGDKEDFNYGKYRRALHREIQLVNCSGEQELKSMPPALWQNIIQGYRIKGTPPKEIHHEERKNIAKHL